jgi:hypothetical protein
MVARTLPNLGLKAFYDLGEDGWKDDQDLGLLKLSVLVQAGVISKVSAEPGAPSDGDVHILDETHGTRPNEIAIRDDGAWVYVVPLEGWLVYNRTANYFEKFDGSVWAEFAAGGGASYPAVVTISGTSQNLLASHAGQYLRFTNAAAKTLTVQDDADEALAADTEYHIRNVGAADLTIVEDTAVTVNPPNGGTLVIPSGGTATLKRVATDEFDLMGQVVAA